MNSDLTICPSCGLTQRLAPLPPGGTAECYRCGMRVATARRDNLNRTAALSLAALLLYVPANIYPVMRLDFYGIYQEGTIWQSCVQLFRDGQMFVATIVFLASMVIPLCKLLGLFGLVISTKFFSARFRPARAWLHRFIVIIGPWAMLDVFLLALLVAVVRLGRVATVTSGPGLVAFTLVVILTILASASFESRDIWNDPATRHESRTS